MSVEASIVEEKIAAGNAARILVVEDERIVARSLRKQLTALGYDVVDSVASGEQAIWSVEELRPDLVLMDISLEGPMDGVAAAAAIRKRFELPVVYLTAYSNKEILDRAKITEPYGYILKPYEDRELHVVIETALYKHRMEQRQRERERWFAATLKSIGDAVVATDDVRCITYMNPAAERLTGWASRDAFGQPLADIVRLVDELTRQPVDSPLDRAVRAGTPSAGVLLIAKDRSEKAVDCSISLLTNENGVAMGGVAVLRDVTWRTKLEAQFRRAQKLEAIGQLAGGVAHSFNNLMASILGHCDLMLQDMMPDDKLFENLQAIKIAGTRTVKLTQKLVAFGRKQILTLLPLNLNAVLRGLAPTTQRLQRGVVFDLYLEPDLGSTWADLIQLEEAILTLAQNACQAMPQGGRVTVETDNVDFGLEDLRDHPSLPSGPYVVLTITDTGVGMSREAIGHLFEPFYTKDAHVGAGMGLAAVYGFVTQCGGDIEVRSQPNKGTTFRVYLPRDSGRSDELDLLA